MARDIKVQRGTTTIALSAATATITAGVDYTAPSATSKAFCRIVSTHSASTNTGNGNTAASVFAARVTQTDITASVVFTRDSASAVDSCRIDWEIWEYTGAGGGANEFIVRAVGEVAFVANTNSVTTGAISGIVTDADVLPFITGYSSGNTSTSILGNTNVTSTWDSGGDTITFTRDRQTGSVAQTVSYAVVEWTGSNWTVQLATKTVTAAGTETSTISTVGDVSRAFVYSQIRGPSTTNELDSSALEVWLSDVTTVSYTAVAGYTANSLTAHAWVVSNADTSASAMVVARYTDTATANGTFTKAITAVTMADAAVVETSNTYPLAASGTSRAISTYRLTATDTVTGYGNDNTTATRSYRFAVVTWPATPGPTITVQPANDVGIISNGQSTVYTATATGTDVLAPTWSEDGTPIADGGVYDIVTTGAGTSSCSSTLTITRTDKTGTPFDIKANFEDDNGDTDTDTVTDTWWTGPTITTFPATDGSGDSATTLTCDYLTGVGEAIELEIPLFDGTVLFSIVSTNVTSLTSTLTSSAASFTAGGAGVTLTFTARDVDSNLIVGYTPVPESGVTP